MFPPKDKKGRNKDKESKWSERKKQYINLLIDSKIESNTVVSNLTEASRSKMKPKWIKGLSGGKQMHIIAIAKQENINVSI